MVDINLKQWATPRQIEVIDAIGKYGSVAEAATALGITSPRLRAHLSEAKRRAARSGYAPTHGMTKTVPLGFHVQGVSTLYNADGEIAGQWVKANKDKEHQLALLLDAVQEIVEPLRGRSTKMPPPTSTYKDRLVAYIMGDPHFGMLAWAAETGAAFDLKVAEETLSAAIHRLVAVSPASETAMIVNVGDFFHMDDTSNRTFKSGNILDVDSRWPKVFSVGLRALRFCVELALTKHQRVLLKNAAGNHDPHSAYVLSLCLASFFENNPRVDVDTSPAKFLWHRFGQNLFGITHGETVKLDLLPSVMAHDRKEDWGQTTFRYWLTGHIHHLTTKEYPGCIVESFRTLASADAWHHANGYRAGREMVCDVYHHDYGRICRHTIGIAQLIPQESV